MLSLRSITTKTSRLTSSTLFRPQQHQRVQSAFFSTTDTESGTVKSYSIKKAYGFIVSDLDNTDIFVHRTGIQGAPGNDNMNPILKKGERMKFKRAPREEGRNGFHAVEVVYEDGSEVPLYRPKFVETSTIRTIKSRLGDTVYDILSKGGDEEVMAQKIADAYTRARDKIESVQNKPKQEVNTEI
mmetsp:Transcript_13304/g.16831  ORF Transcript_13304/g.16831 Transcript_13304/m.16831 type:complete len:185 (+) Transcript_13304:164-718(+)